MSDSTFTAFVTLVGQMRQAQKEYFFMARYGTLIKQKALDEAKKLEKQVDTEIERFSSSQTNLF